MFITKIWQPEFSPEAHVKVGEEMIPKSYLLTSMYTQNEKTQAIFFVRARFTWLTLRQMSMFHGREFSEPWTSSYFVILHVLLACNSVFFWHRTVLLKEFDELSSSLNIFWEMLALIKSLLGAFYLFWFVGLFGFWFFETVLLCTTNLDITTILWLQSSDAGITGRYEPSSSI